MIAAIVAAAAATGHAATGHAAPQSSGMPQFNPEFDDRPVDARGGG